MDDMIEKRVGDLESLVWEIPNLLNLRFERFRTEHASFRKAIEDNTDRLIAVERIISLVQADMRDLRSGVTHQLVAQDETIRELVTRLDALEIEIRRRFAAIEERQAALDKGQATLLKGQASLEKGQAALEKGQASLEKGQAALEKGHATLEQGQAAIDKRLESVDAKLDAILRRLPGA